MRTITMLLTGLALLIAACASTDPAEAAGRGRLAVVDDAGNVAVLQPDGNDVIAVTDDATSSSVYVQPTWAPDGRHLAFSRAGTDGAEVVIHDTADATAERIETPSPAFYFSWADDGDRVAYLANDTGGAGLTMAILDVEATPIRDDVGRPYYFSWGADGSMVEHIGLDRLAVVDAAGEDEDWSLGSPGVFRAPQWIESGVLFVERGSPTSRLVLGPERGDPRTIAEVGEGAAFIASPAGDRVAVQTVGAGQGDEFAVNARRVGAQEAPTLPANRLVVVDLETLEWTRVGEDRPVIAFWWSPAGDRLLVLTLESQQRAALGWRVWSDDGLSDPIEFTPAPELARDVLPFFDQYAQSLSFWAPDGSAFAFPGSIDDESGIFVVETGEDPSPTKIADGSWVAWGTGP